MKEKGSKEKREAREKLFFSSDSNYENVEGKKSRLEDMFFLILKKKTPSSCGCLPSSEWAENI